jgi:putative NIF3 family GTP cyclohydrolase 1 type 2
LKLAQIYELAVKKGIEQDPRGADVVQKALKSSKKMFEDLKPQQKQEFDKEALVNPYADTRILYGNPEKDIRSILLGIDIDVGEVLLADRLREKGRSVDLVMAHHPGGRAYAGFYEVMHMQTDILGQLGVPINIAEALLDDRIKEVARRVHSANHARPVDAARLLDIAFMCVHTPADNHVTSYLQKLINKQKPEFISDLITLLKDVPEYKEASKRNAGPKVILGSEKNSAGKIIVDMTGGTEGSKDIFRELSKAGVSTIVGMHLSDDHIKKAQEVHLNIIIAGHIASDTLGLNLLLDQLIKKGNKIEIISCSGFVRIER